MLRKPISIIMLAMLLTGMFPSLFNLFSFATEQPPMEWEHTYGGTSDDIAYSMVQTSDGGYALAGYTRSCGAGSADFWLVKTDSSGIMLWNKTYGGSSAEIAYSMVQTSDGGYALAGYIYVNAPSNYDFWLVRTDAAGNELWNQSFGGAGQEMAYSVIQMGEAGFGLVGYTNSKGAGGKDFWLVVTDSSGNKLFDQTYGGTGDDIAYSVVWTWETDGGYAIAGLTLISGTQAFWLVKTDDVGKISWTKSYEEAGTGFARSVIQTYDGGFGLAGYGYSSGFLFVKTGATGNMHWSRSYEAPSGGGDAYSLILAFDGGCYALAGRTGGGNSDFWLVKTDSAGNALWNGTYGGSGADAPYSVVRTTDGGFALAGYTYSYGAGGADFWLVKIPPWTPPPPPPDFSMVPFPPLLTVQQGSSDTSTISLSSRGGFNQLVQLAVSGAPPGVSPTLDPPEVTPSEGVWTESTLTVYVSPSAAPGTYPLTVTGTSGSLIHSIYVTLEIPLPENQPPALTAGYVTPPSGDTSTVFNYYVLYTDPDNDAPASSQVYIDGSAHTMTKVSGDYVSGATYRYSTNLALGSHNFHFTFDDGNGHTVMLPPSGTYSGPSVSPTPTADFAIVSSQTSLTIEQGKSGSSTITIYSINGFNQPVQLSITAPPPGVTASFNVPTVTPPSGGSADSTLTFSVAAEATPGGPFALTLTGTSGSLQRSTPIYLQISAHAPRTLTVYSSPSGVSFTANGISHTTPWSGTYNSGDSASLVMPLTYSAGDPRYYWDEWSDGVASQSRTIVMNSDATATGCYTGPYYELIIASSPTSGIPFTVNEVSQTTSYSEWLYQGYYTIEMPATYNGYVWQHWLEDGDTSRIRTVSLTYSNMLTAVYSTPDFSISAPPTSLIILQGRSGSSTITVTSISGFSQPVHLDVSGQYGVGLTLSHGQVTPTPGGSATSTLTASVYAWATSGTYTLTVSGSSGTLIHNTYISLQIGLVFHPPYAVGDKDAHKTTYGLARADCDSYVDEATGVGRIKAGAAVYTYFGVADAGASITFINGWTSTFSGEYRIVGSFRISGDIAVAIVKLQGLAMSQVALNAWLTVRDVTESRDVFKVGRTISSLEIHDIFAENEHYDDSSFFIEGLLDLNEGHTYSWIFEIKVGATMSAGLAAGGTAWGNIRETKLIEIHLESPELWNPPQEGPVEAIENVLWVAIGSPVELLVTDSMGRRVGFDSISKQVVNEIPDAWYSNSDSGPQFVYIPRPLSDSNKIILAGTDTGTYELMAAFITHGEVIPFTAIEIPTSTNAIHQYSADWPVLSHGGEGVTAMVDFDGNGVAEYNFTSDSELNRLEYVAATTQHDLGITEMTSSERVIGAGYSHPINITVMNYGVYTETINVTIYANATFVALQTVDLASGNSTRITYLWNTTGFAKGNYTLAVQVMPVPGETYTADNNLTDGWVFISMVGDLTGGTPNPWDFVPDGKCDGKDITIVALCFGSAPGCQPPWIWNPNSDVNNDAKVDGKDIATVALHYGQADP